MALLLDVKGVSPIFGADCWLAPNATICGNVTTGNHCSFWFNAVVRGDVHSITIGDRVNIQDGAVIHCTYKKAATVIGNNVSIGHNALVHGCTIHDHVLIGMGSIVMDNCIIESGSIIAAGAVLLEGTHVTAGSIFAGVPAKKVKSIDAASSVANLEKLASNYVMYSGWFKGDEDHPTS
ncbi:MAG: carbonic anhydrase/acetyltransferase-like protein (isoleucine patch superfamily) [Flavobacteriales bacterium]|jgi:carbonic anhydrase/acetyltransferase-like protein (isoleucine patch superfamily)